MKRLTTIVCASAATLLSACVGTDGYYGGNAGYSGSYYGGYANYNSSCDYYSPPWGYPADYCRYQIWNQPVYYGGLWYGGPIYYRTYGGLNWYWLHDGWRRDAWHGPRPHIDWHRGGNHYWRGEMRRGRDGRPQRDANGTPPNGGGGISNNPGANDGDGNAVSDGRDRLRRGRRNAESGAPSNVDAGNAPPPDRDDGFRNNRGRNDVAENYRGENNVARSVPRRDSVSTPRLSRSGITRNDTRGDNIGRAADRRGAATRRPRGREGD